MDFKVAAALSAVETALLLRGGEQPTPGQPATAAAVAKLWLALFLAQYLLAKTYRLVLYPSFVSPLRHLPGPRDDHPLIGQTARMFAAPSPHHMYEAWARRWPDAPFVRHLTVFNAELLMVNSLAAHRECLATHGYDFVKAPFWERLIGEFLPGSILFINGEEHRRRRRILAGPLSLARVRGLVPVFQAKARDFVKLLEARLDAGGEEGVFEVESNLGRLTLDIIGYTALGIELDQLRSSSSSSMKFHECYRTLLQPSPLGAVITFLNAYVPLRWLPLESNRSFVKANESIQGMIRSVVRQRVEQVKAKGEEKGGDGDARREGRDLLTYFLEDELPGRGGLSETEISQSLFELLAAGHDTSASALTFAVYELAMKPDLQDRCRAEVMAALEGNPDPDSVVLESLHLMDNFIREVLRMYSPTINSVRQAVKDMVIEGVPIAKGTTIVIAPAAIQRNPRVWGADADAFDPDRWDRLEGTDAASPYAFEAFNNGPRICPGRQYALLEIKAVLFELLRAVRFGRVEGGGGGGTVSKFQNPALTLKPREKLMVRYEVVRS